jgi:hypothetical protein
MDWVDLGKTQLTHRSIFLNNSPLCVHVGSSGGALREQRARRQQWASEWDGNDQVASERDGGSEHDSSGGHQTADARGECDEGDGGRRKQQARRWQWRQARRHQQRRPRAISDRKDRRLQLLSAAKHLLC